MKPPRVRALLVITLAWSRQTPRDIIGPISTLSRLVQTRFTPLLAKHSSRTGQGPFLESAAAKSSSASEPWSRRFSALSYSQCTPRSPVGSTFI
jgi:hypothetical protein